MLATANAANGVREGIDFFPLTVDVEERAYAAGKIPGSFFRREGRPTEHAILTCRLIDRPLRPSFPDGLPQRDPGRRSPCSAPTRRTRTTCWPSTPRRRRSCSRASPSTAPSAPCAWPTPPRASGYPTPPTQEGDASTFELVVAGRQLDDGDVAIMMVEAGGTENGLELLRGGRAQGHRGGHRRGPRGGQAVDQGVDRAAARARRRRPACTSRSPTRPVVDYGDDVCASGSQNVATPKLAEAVTIVAKAERNDAIDAATQRGRSSPARRRAR